MIHRENEMRLASLVAPIGLAALSACAETPAAPDTGNGATCNAGQFTDDLGRPVGELDLPEERQVRVIGPDEAVTMDYMPTRLNIEVDDENRVVRVYCG